MAEFFAAFLAVLVDEGLDGCCLFLACVLEGSGICEKAAFIAFERLLLRPADVSLVEEPVVCGVVGEGERYAAYELPFVVLDFVGDEGETAVVLGE